MSDDDDIAAVGRLVAAVEEMRAPDLSATLRQLIEQCRAVGPGYHTLKTRAGIAARNYELCQAAIEFKLPTTRLHVALSRYVATAWPRDRLLDRMPARYAGKLEARLFRAMQAHPRAPRRRRLAAIVSGTIPPVLNAIDIRHDGDSEGDQHEVHERSRRRANGSA